MHTDHGKKGEGEMLAEVLSLIVTAGLIATLRVRSRLKALTFHTVHHLRKQINIYSF